MGRKGPMPDAHKRAIAEGQKRGAAVRKADERLGRAIRAYVVELSDESKEEYYAALEAALRLNNEDISS